LHKSLITTVFLIGTNLLLCQSKRRSLHCSGMPVQYEWRAWYVKTKCGAGVLVSIAVSCGRFGSRQLTHRTEFV